MARILLLEEDKSLRDLIQLFSQDEGYEIVAVQNITQALREARRTTFDLIVRDSLAMTPEQFFQAPDPLLALPSRPPILVLTGHALDPQRLRALGYAGVIQKPFDIEDLGDALRRVLGEETPG